eukprot:7243080-Heterocapsa_arctica.AAC.1
MVLGLGFIFSKEAWAELTGIPSLVNSIENGLQAARPTQEQLEEKEAENRKVHDEKMAESHKEFETTIRRNVITEIKKLFENMQISMVEEIKYTRQGLRSCIKEKQTLQAGKSEEEEPKEEDTGAMENDMSDEQEIN